MYHVIDTQTDERSYGWIAFEHSKITLTLVEMDAGKFGVLYDAQWWGAVDGHAADGPFEVRGNQNTVVHSNPDVRVQITGWKIDPTVKTISAHVQVYVDINLGKVQLGTQLVFDKVLSGAYGRKDLAAMMRELAAAVQPA